jgi:hypothetical protein
MVNNEIWLDSQATVSMIPEQDIYLGAFPSSGPASTVSGDKRTINIGSGFTAHFNLVTNLYRGCILDIYNTSDVLQDRARIISNTATALVVLDSVSIGTVGANVTDLSGFYGVIHHYGAPVPAPKGAASASALLTATVTTAGDSLTSDLSLLTNAEIVAGAPASGSGAEISLTLSAHSTAFTFIDNNGSRYESGAGADGSIRVFADNGDGTATSIDVVFADDSGSTPSLGGNVTLTVDIAEDAEGAEIAEAVRIALNDSGEAITATRAANVLTVTNTNGGAVSNSTETTDGGVSTVTNTAGGVITNATITAAGSGFTAGGAITVTSSGTNGVITVTIGGENPRLLSDTWLGLANSITVPTTSTEAKQLNVGIGGTRNFTYQFKGVETTSDFSLTAMANSVPWLYYTLGSATITSSTSTSQTITDDGFTAGSANGFLVRTPTKEGDNLLHRVIAGEVCPPFNDETATTLLDDDTSPITYSITENDSSDLPSFAIEYTLKKPGNASTVATDANKETVYSKVYPGCTVSQLVLTAAAGQELECQVTAMPKKTFIMPSGYDTLNNQTDVGEFVNFGTRGGQTTSATTMEPLMRPFFFSDGTVELFGESFLKIENMTLTIDNGLQQKRFIGRYDKRSQETFAGQRTYNLTFTAMVTDGDLFDHFRQEHAFSLTGSGTGASAPIKLRFTKENNEEIELQFKDYHVTAAEFPLTNDNSPIIVNFTVVPLALQSCTLQTYWAIQG